MKKLLMILGGIGLTVGVVGVTIYFVSKKNFDSNKEIKDNDVDISKENKEDNEDKENSIHNEDSTNENDGKKLKDNSGEKWWQNMGEKHIAKHNEYIQELKNRNLNINDISNLEAYKDYMEYGNSLPKKTEFYTKNNYERLIELVDKVIEAVKQMPNKENF